MRLVMADFHRGKIRKGLQGKLYKALVENREDTWKTLLESRAAMFRGSDFPLPSTWHYGSDLLTSWALVSKGLNVSCMMTLLKSWVNAWCTTTRYSEAVEWPCIFGCIEEDDSLRHYLQCPLLWSRVSAYVETHVDPLVRLGLDRPTSLRLKLMVVASRCYHTIKFNRREVIETAVSSGDFSKVWHLLDVLAPIIRDETGVT